MVPNILTDRMSDDEPLAVLEIFGKFARNDAR